MRPIQTERAKAARRLQSLYEALPTEERRMLLEFAEFLASRAPKAPPPPQEPVPHARPEKESVVKAVKRLSATYPMLDKSRMLNQTSSLVAKHVMQGRPAVEVIDELEALFVSHYRQFLQEIQADQTE